MQHDFTVHGFLPAADPAVRFEMFPELALLDELGRDLPSLLIDANARQYLHRQEIPKWPTADITPEMLPELRLYYVRLGFLASGYINQVGQPAEHVLPAHIAVPLAEACRLLDRPPILSYDGYALYNWKRFDPTGPIALGNIDTIQDFVHLYDEHWFILVHVEIESQAAEALAAIEHAAAAITNGDDASLNACLRDVADVVRRLTGTLRRIPEHMDPALYFRTFRPYIRFFENVVYEGVSSEPLNHRGETGAQSSVIPALVSFLKIEHQPTELTNHLHDMRRFMPAEHRQYLEQIERFPSPRPIAEPDAYNEVIEALATFREVHHGWAMEYIQKWVTDPRGTGGTPYLRWLQQLIDETRAHALPSVQHARR